MVLGPPAACQGRLKALKMQDFHDLGLIGEDVDNPSVFMWTNSG